jgi:hypothetical protein
MLHLIRSIDGALNEEEIDASDKKYQDANMLQLIVSSLMRLNNITVRVALYVSELDLREFFLAGAKSGGTGDGSKILELIDSDEELVKIARHFNAGSPTTEDIKIRRILPEKPGMFKFSQLIDSTGVSQSPSDVILLNVPKQIFDKVKAAGADLSTPEKREAFRKSMTQLLSYRYYLMTLDLAQSKKIASKMDAASNEEGWMEFFNPFRVIKNHPSKARLDAAKEVWNETQNPEIAGEREIKSLERGAERAERAREASKRAMGSASDLENVILSSILSSSGSTSGFNPQRVAAGLKNILKNSHTKDEIIASLEKLDKLGSPKITQVKDEMVKIPNW